MSKALVVLSGGQDSTTCLYWALRQFDEVYTVTFDYGQRHSREIFNAAMVAEEAGIPSERQSIVGIGNDILQGDSPLVSDNDLEQYADHASLPGGLENTFVPMRNQMFLTIAANRAYVLKCTNLVTGVCQEDYGGYPDCRRNFIDAIEQACNLGTFTGEDGVVSNLTIHTPLMYLTKAESVGLAIDLGAFYTLSLTHTAYDGKFPPTGHDHATLLRNKGFEVADTPDPLVLRAALMGVMELPPTKNYGDDLRALIDDLSPLSFSEASAVLRKLSDVFPVYSS